ncbi:CynX/NimT family MFS transporter [Microbispora sp. NBC_01389]|uniref:MFS transporter n=1 Tax=Microbispora sp. NBC_01389 TaxID=2903584 RepID=UPI003252CC3B
MTPQLSSGESQRDPAREAPASRSPWVTIIVIYLAGVAAAMSLGKFSPVEPQVTAQFGLSSSQLGWVISAVVALGAVAGLPAGYLVRRVGAARSLVVALVLMVAASALSAAAGNLTWLLTARVAESAGYLLVSITCPALILRLAHERDRGVALSGWATFVPVGIGLSTLAGGAVGTALGWRGWVLLIAGTTLVMTVVVRARLPWASAPETDPETAAGSVPGARALAWPALLTVAFCLMVLVTIPVIVLLPTLLIKEHGLSAAAAGALTSVISLAGVPGGLAVGLLLRRGVPLGALAASGLLVVPAAWLTYAGGGSLAAAVTGAGVISLENGLLGALVFAALPQVLERLDHADAGNGLVTQMGSLGSLLGPPLFGLVAGAFGYGAAVPVIVAGMAASVGILLLVARHVSGRARRVTPETG